MECEHECNICVRINCGLETKHEFIYFGEDIVCNNCGLEKVPIITPERVSFDKKERPKDNELATIKDRTNLRLDPVVTSTSYEMYQNCCENKIDRSKMRTVILCVCICMANKWELDRYNTS